MLKSLGFRFAKFILRITGNDAAVIPLEPYQPITTDDGWVIYGQRCLVGPETIWSEDLRDG
jgi:hypothetical protein